LKALESLEAGASMRKVAEEFGVSLGTVAGWKKSKEDLRDRAAQNAHILSKRSSRVKGDGAIIDERVYNWFLAARAERITVSGPMVQEKALMVAGHLGNEEFKASNGWLECFRKRHNIKFKLESGESADMDPVVTVFN
jgi:transposase-like protein